MSHKRFSEKLHQELDKMDVPKPFEERVAAFAKLIKIPKFQAASILNGKIPAEEALIQSIAKELEVDPEWLIN